MQNTPKADGRERWHPGSLVRTLLGRLRSRRASANPSPLAPPGKRSGQGLDSIEPYLRQTRDSRPGPLE